MTSLDTGKLVKVYLKMKAARDALAAEYDEKLEALDEQMKQVKTALLDFLKEQGLDSAKTEHGLFYRTIKKRYWTNDWASMGAFIVEHNVPDLLEKRLHQGNTQQFLEANPDLLPPGLNTDSEFVINVRKK